MVTTHYMDEAEHCQNLAFIQGGRLVAMGSPQETKINEMHGQVLEVDCDQPEVAIATLRQLGLFEEVALYGALIHVITEDPEVHEPLIEQTLHDAGVHITSVDRIAPSLEDVFIASVRRRERDLRHEA
jgi:ABC-2 type transport system ATP-binding protein